MRKILSALVVAAAAFAMLPGSASAQVPVISIQDFMLVGDGCPEMGSAMVTLTPQSANAPGQLSIRFADEMDAFVVSGADAQRSCMVAATLSNPGQRVSFTIARGNVNATFSGGEQGVLSVTSSVMLGRRQSAPISVQLNDRGVANSDDAPDGLAARTLDRINTSFDFRGTTRLVVEISAQTVGASPGATIQIQEIDLLNSVVLDVAG